MDRRGLLQGGGALIGTAAAAGCVRSAARRPANDRQVTFLLNPAQIAYLPVFYALERGDFAAEGVDAVIKTYSGSANAQLPLLARGDVDVAGVIAAPALFNQAAAGFGIRLLCALTVPEASHIDAVAIMVRQDIWRSGAVRRLQDLRGHSVDGAAEGNPIDLLIRFALINAGLTPSEVRLSYKIRTPSDVVHLFQEKQVDVAGVSEPTATLISERGLAHKWISYRDVIPWYQDTFLGASEDFVKSRPVAAAGVVRACLRAAGAINQARGAWTPATLAAAVKWSRFKPADLKAMGGVPYWSGDGAVDGRALDRVQQYWVGRRFVRTPTDVAALLGPAQVAHV